MLQPRETDLPGLFMVLVVLPLVLYVILGKWSEASKKNERISELAQVAAEEAFRVETMAAAAAVIPLVPVSKSNNAFHKCARCFGVAKTRCSRCKSVRYCSGKCQIIHWRQLHKHECQRLDQNTASNEGSVDEQFLFGEKLDSHFSESNIKQFGHEKTASDDMPTDACGSVFERRSSEKHSSSKFNREMSRNGLSVTLEPSEDSCSTSYDNSPSKGASARYKSKRSHLVLSKDDVAEKSNADVSWFADSEKVAQNVTKTHKSAKSTVKASRDQLCSERGCVDQVADADDSRLGVANVVAHESNIANKGFMKMIGLKRSSKHDKLQNDEVNRERHKKMKMLFPYEEFVKFFRYEAFDLLPRGLVNCGNSCYANAVLQCLTSTKPLVIYLLRQSHSRACCAKSWCLVCELEHHVLMLRDKQEPMSLSRILVHMRSANNQIGDGSQEDAHEFLRVLVTSMQSICLEGLGGEGVVDPKLQETTFIQHTFGGQLRSKVKCLRCHRESDRYENIMDLTLEILGWVESLEDALTQFTSPEDLDGENMYRCGRCAAYVRAQKQLAIQEAPNILTIVLKRFQEGNYGKINKCITFPEMLDMIPFMTGTDDVPPLYMLYGVVVHLDTMNESFSGHYISYVKDLQGNWFRIDDTQVQPVPLSRVMSEGAYILFYMRSSPRPVRTYTGKSKASGFEKHRMPKAPKSTPDQEPKDFQMQSNRNRPSSCIDFSDATSSDWSIFTSSDDASFTTESTRDSFSTIDYTDNDPISSIFNTLYATPDYTVSCSRVSRSRPHSIMKSYHRSHKVCSSDSIHRTSGHCTL